MPICSQQCILNSYPSHMLHLLFLCIVTPHSGDQSTAATWLKELQGSPTGEPCQSSTPWRATWRRDGERPLLPSTPTKPSAPSPPFQGTSHPLYLTTSNIFFNLLIYSYMKITNNGKCACFGWLCRLGCPGFTKPEYRPSPVDSGVAKSLFFPDEAINRHPRYR